MARRENPPQFVSQNWSAERPGEGFEVVDSVRLVQTARAQPIVDVIRNPRTFGAAHECGTAELVAAVLENAVQADAAAARVGGNRSGADRHFGLQRVIEEAQ